MSWDTGRQVVSRSQDRTACIPGHSDRPEAGGGLGHSSTQPGRSF